MSCIEIRGLRKTFGSTVALNGLDLTVAEGRMAALVLLMTHRIDGTQYVGVKLACLALVVGLVMRWRATERTALAAA